MKRILVVDADAAFRKLMHERLKRAGYLVEEAENGFKAIAAIDRKTPDLILMDIVISGINGYEVMHYIKFDKKLPQLPIVLMISKELAMDAGLSSALGVDCLDKEISAQAIVERIVSLLGSSKEKVKHHTTYVDKEAKKRKELDRTFFEREKRMLEDYVEKTLREKAERNRSLA